MFSCTACVIHSYVMSKPLSAIRESPGWKRFKMPLRSVSCLSDIDPGYKSETKVTAPDGLMAINNLKVL